MAFDGRIHRLEGGCWLKFDIKRISVSKERPHGLRYSFTMQDPRGTRLVGFDNAHGIVTKGNRYRKLSPEYDHWHRTQTDEGRPYNFTSAEKLLADFEAEVYRVLNERNIGDDVLKDD